MEKEITKVDIIVRALGLSNPEIKRLVELENEIRTSAALGNTEVKDCIEYGVTAEAIMEWKTLMDKYYDEAVGILQRRAKEAN